MAKESVVKKSVAKKSVDEILSDLEKERKPKAVKLRILGTLTAVVTVVFLYFAIDLSMNYPNGMEGIVFYLFLLLLAVVFAVNLSYVKFFFKTKKNFYAELKTKVMPIYLSEIGKIKWHDAKKTVINDKHLRESGLFMVFNTRTNDDQFRGEYKAVEYKISETSLQDIHGSGKYTTVVNTFRGVIINFELKKYVQNTTIVSSKWNFTGMNRFWPIFVKSFSSVFILGCFLYLLITYGWQAFWSLLFSDVKAPLAFAVSVICSYFAIKEYKSLKMNLKKVILESNEFNNKFNVYSSDQIEARRILSPKMMEKLYDVKTAFKAKGLKCSFNKDNLVIALTVKDNVFEIGSLWRPLKRIEKGTGIYKEIKSILSLIDYFELEDRWRIHTT